MGGHYLLIGSRRHIALGSGITMGEIESLEGTDTRTGLMWEKKTGDIDDVLEACTDLDDCPDPHNVTNTYRWTNNITVPTGSAYTNFIGRLNGAQGDIGGNPCFANYCDWRLATVTDLKSIHPQFWGDECASLPCIYPELGPTLSECYWSNSPWLLDDSALTVCYQNDEYPIQALRDKFLASPVRAVRGEWRANAATGYYE